MCQLTLLDFDPKTFISRTFVRSLTELNTYGWAGKNDDGFGYMTFTKPGKITKSNLDAMSWWAENEKDFLRFTRNGNGIYHVRLASNNIKDVLDKDAHPFMTKDIVLMHNGTLTEKKSLEKDKEMQKLFETEDKDAPMIDSEKFTEILANVVGDNKLTPAHIDLAMENFTGAFCFLICDLKQPKNIHIVRGKDRILHVAEFFDTSDKTTEYGKPIGVAINTGRLELIYWSKLVKMAMQQYSKIKLNIRVSELEKEHIWKYRVGSYTWNDPIAEIKQRAAESFNVFHGGRPSNSPARSSKSTDKSTWEDLADLSLETGLHMQEVFVMSELLFSKALHILNEKEINTLYDIVVTIDKENTKGRTKEWNKGLRDKNLTSIEAYKQTGLEFPFVYSSKKMIRRGFNSIKEKK